MTAFVDITRAVEALLKQAPALAAGNIERSRLRRVQPDSAAALRIYPQNADGRAAAVKGGFTSWRFEITLECLARAAVQGADQADAEAAADALLQAVWQRLADAPPPAGVHSLLNDPRISWEMVEAEVPLCAALLTFSVELSTYNRTLAPWT